MVPNGNAEPDGGAHTIVGVGSQRSVALAEYVADAPAALVHSSVMALGHVMLGGVVSTTVTLKQHVDEFW